MTMGISQENRTTDLGGFIRSRETVEVVAEPQLRSNTGTISRLNKGRIQEVAMS